MKKENIGKIIKNLKVMQKESLAEEFFIDMDCMFWREFLKKWELEKAFDNLIEQKFKKEKKKQPLITKDDIKRDFYIMLKEEIKARIFKDIENTEKRESVSYIG
tara:strand:- start:3 stop:314 length:312 start_codon:yes stop_codon:yes gene_type:complete